VKYYGDNKVEKLKTLLGNLGASKELTESIIKELTTFQEGTENKYKTKYENEYKTKMEKAKKICVEEVVKEKEALARKVAVYLESKVNSITQASTKQRALEEAESKSILRRTKALLEGIDIKDDGALVNYQNLAKKTERMEKALLVTKEERDLAIQKANKSNEIAAKALKRCNTLDEQIKTFQAKAMISDSKKVDPAAAAKPITEAKPQVPAQGKKLDEGRIYKETPKTTTKINPAGIVNNKKSAPNAGLDDIEKIAGML
jgi:hypothetical protein